MSARRDTLLADAMATIIALRNVLPVPGTNEPGWEVLAGLDDLISRWYVLLDAESMGVELEPDP